MTLTNNSRTYRNVSISQGNILWHEDCHDGEIKSTLMSSLTMKNEDTEKKTNVISIRMRTRVHVLHKEQHFIVHDGESESLGDATTLNS